MRNHTFIGFSLLAPLSMLAQDASVTQASMPLASELRSHADAKVERVMLTRCSDGSVLAFSSKSVDSVANTTVTLKKRAAVATLPAFPADSQQQWLALELANFALSNDAINPMVGTDSGTVMAGSLSIRIGRSKSQVSCTAEALLAAYPDIDPLDDRVAIRQAGSAADPVAWAFIAQAKKNKPNTKGACVVNVLSPDAVAPLRDASLAAFYEALDPKKDAFRNGPLPAGGVPVDNIGYELRILNIGMVRLARAQFVGFGKITMDASQMAYMVVDRSTGTVVKRGRVQRAIGKDTLKDIKDLGRYISC